MPVFLLLLIATLSGLIAALLTRRHSGRAVAPLDADEPTGLALTLALVVIFAGGAVLALLAVLVRSSDLLAGIDSSVAEWGNHHASAWSHDVLVLITSLGETWTVVVVAAVVALVELARTRSRWVVPFLLAVIVGDKLLTWAVKELVDRARPTIEAVAATLGPSFPSGHTSTAAASWAAFALVAGRWWGRRAWPALAGLAVGIAVAVAGSRVLLDVHWLTDVLGGLALGWAWFAACAIAFGNRLRQLGAPPKVAAGGHSQAGASPPSRSRSRS
jgi:membrane-associated phospholipid phosphatase